MIENTASQADDQTSPASGQSQVPVKKKRLGCLRVMSMGCLSIVLLIAGGIAFILILGALGLRGDGDSSPAWSPDGSRIAFVSDRGGDRDIFTMNADGSNVHQLTRNPWSFVDPLTTYIDDGPEWSPDGKQILFNSSRKNVMMRFVAQSIFIMNTDGTQIHEPKNDWDMEWYVIEQMPDSSPDGTQIVFMANENGNDHLYVMNANGTEMKQLTKSRGDEGSPVWSQDGKEIAFSSNRYGNFSILVMDADATNIRRLTKSKADDFSPTWSPDGSQIAFSSTRDGNFAIFVMNADGSNVQRLTDPASDSYQPDWSPDGSRIAFVSNRDGDSDIYVMNPDGTEVLQLTGK